MRVQVLLSDEERESFRSQARAVGKSLSAWLREAASQRLERDRKDRRLDTADDLDSFFAACRKREVPGGTEPDWEEHQRVIARSRHAGLGEP